MAEGEYNFRILIDGTIEERLEAQREPLGFHSANALAAIYVKAFSEVPAARVFEALATLEKFKGSAPKRGPFRP